MRMQQLELELRVQGRFLNALENCMYCLAYIKCLDAIT